MTVDTTVIEQVVGTTVSVALRNLVMGIGGIVILFALAPKLAGLMLLGIPLIVVPIVPCSAAGCARSRPRSQDRIADVGTIAAKSLGAMKIVQAFGQEQREAARFGDAVERVFATAKRRILLRAIMTAIVILLLFGSITMLIWQGAVDVAAGRISGGTIAAFVLTGGLVAGAFGALTEVYGDLLRAAGAAERLAELLDAEPEIQRARQPVAAARARRAASSRSSSVTFRYPTRRETSRAARFHPRRRARASGWRWSARRAPARRRSSSSPSASTIRSRAACGSTASTCATPIPPRSASASRWCRRRR